MLSTKFCLTCVKFCLTCVKFCLTFLYFFRFEPIFFDKPPCQKSKQHKAQQHSRSDHADDASIREVPYNDRCIHISHLFIREISQHQNDRDRDHKEGEQAEHQPKCRALPRRDHRQLLRHNLLYKQQRLRRFGNGSSSFFFGKRRRLLVKIALLDAEQLAHFLQTVFPRAINSAFPIANCLTADAHQVRQLLLRHIDAFPQVCDPCSHCPLHAPPRGPPAPAISLLYHTIDCMSMPIFEKI